MTPVSSAPANDYTHNAATLNRLSTDAVSDGGTPVIASKLLLQGQTAVLIEHLGQHYRLQATRQGKLILTK